MLKLKVTTRALRCIHKAGGLDNYVMKTKSDLLGMEGMRLRVLVRARLDEQARIAEKAAAEQRVKEKEERRIAFNQKQADAEKQRRERQAARQRAKKTAQQVLAEGILGTS
jgi:large subunit ribosomal protein L28